MVRDIRAGTLLVIDQALIKQVFEGITHRLTAHPKLQLQRPLSGQLIAGAAGAVEKACAALKEAGAKRAIMLNVSAPFHSSLMEPAAQKLKKVLDKIEIKDAEIPVIANVNALAETKAADIRTHLVEQAAHAVRWEESVRNLIAGGMDTMVECGPGTVLSGFMRKIDKSIVSYHAENIETIIETVQALKGV